MVVEKINGKVYMTINGITKSRSEWAKDVGVSIETLRQRIQRGWSDDNILNAPAFSPNSSNKFNEHYFDIIDDEHKAYWIGFIWCDGYCKNNDTKSDYCFVLSQNSNDAEHLEKFKTDIEGSAISLRYYDYSPTAFKANNQEARITINNKYFVKNLSENYGLIPHRCDCSKLISNIPDSLMKHFIRGLVDADGSFSFYNIKQNNYICNKYSLSIGSNADIVKCAEQYLINNDLIPKYDRKLYKRHKDRDGEYVILSITGKKNVINVLTHIYENSDIYLTRKYDKYLNILEESKKERVKSEYNYQNATIRKHNTSGHPGVSFHKKTNKWSARIDYNCKSYYLGEFVNIEDAIKARLDAERMYKGE